MGIDPGLAAPDRRRSPIANAVATYGANVAAAALGLVNVLIVSRVLGTAGRGDVAFVLAMTMLVSQLAAFGVQTANANFGGSQPGLLSRLAGNSVLLAALFGAAAIAVVSLLIELAPAVGGQVDAGTRWIALASAPLLILGNYLW